MQQRLQDPYSSGWLSTSLDHNMACARLEQSFLLGLVEQVRDRSLSAQKWTITAHPNFTTIFKRIITYSSLQRTSGCSSKKQSPAASSAACNPVLAAQPCEQIHTNLRANKPHNFVHCQECNPVHMMLNQVCKVVRRCA